MKQLAAGALCLGLVMAACSSDHDTSSPAQTTSGARRASKPAVSTTSTTGPTTPRPSTTRRSSPRSRAPGAGPTETGTTEPGTTGPATTRSAPTEPDPTVPSTTRAPTLPRPGRPLTRFGDGSFRVNVDVAAGVYEAFNITDGCHWETVDAAGTTLASETVDVADRVQATISSAAADFNSDHCGRWRRVR